MRSNRSGSILVAAMVVALAGCSDDLSNATPTQFVALLTGVQEVPAVTTNASGTSSITLTGTGLTGNVTYSGLTPTAIHVHIGNGSVANGTIAWNICGAGGAPACGASPVNVALGELAATSTLAALTTALRAAGTGAYVNIHTATNTGGEIRGQYYRNN